MYRYAIAAFCAWLIMHGVAEGIGQLTTGTYMSRLLGGAAFLIVIGWAADYCYEGTIPDSPMTSAITFGLIAGLLTIAFWR